MIQLYIDPGKHASGWALFENQLLRRAGFSPPKLFSLYVNEITIERPQVYAPSRSKGDPNDLIDLAIVAGRWIGLYPSAAIVCTGDRIGVYPRDWKGQLPKRVTERRARGALEPSELEIVPKIARTSGGSDMWDAIALGLVRLRRLRMR